MSNNLSSHFQMKRYYIYRLHFDNPLADCSPDAAALCYFAKMNHAYADGQWNGTIALGFRLMPAEDADKDIQNGATLMEAIIIGEFAEPTAKNDSNEALFVTHLKLNGAATLIPILRSAVCTTGSIMGFPNQYSLPNIDVRQLDWDAGDDIPRPKAPK